MTYIVISIHKGYDRRGRKITVNLSDGDRVTDMKQFFNSHKALKYVRSLMSQGYEIEAKYSIVNFDLLKG